MKHSALVLAMARGIYESHQFKKSWDHPDTVKLWHPVCLREAEAAFNAYRQYCRKISKKAKAA